MIGLGGLYLWHREQEERWSNLAANTKSTLPKVQLATLKRGYLRQAKFHHEAAELLKGLKNEQGS